MCSPCLTTTVEYNIDDNCRFVKLFFTHGEYSLQFVAGDPIAKDLKKWYLVLVSSLSPQLPSGVPAAQLEVEEGAL